MIVCILFLKTYISKLPNLTLWMSFLSHFLTFIQPKFWAETSLVNPQNWPAFWSFTIKKWFSTKFWHMNAGKWATNDIYVASTHQPKLNLRPQIHKWFSFYQLLIILTVLPNLLYNCKSKCKFQVLCLALGYLNMGWSADKLPTASILLLLGLLEIQYSHYNRTMMI